MGIRPANCSAKTKKHVKFFFFAARNNNIEERYGEPGRKRMVAMEKRELILIFLMKFILHSSRLLENTLVWTLTDAEMECSIPEI